MDAEMRRAVLSLSLLVDRVDASMCYAHTSRWTLSEIFVKRTRRGDCLTVSFSACSVDTTE